MNASSTKILVTGALGFLGQQTVKILENTDNTIIRCGHHIGPTLQNKDCDIGCTSELLKLLGDIEPDYIINLAAKISFEDENADCMSSVNSLAPALMANYCAETGAVLIQASSSSVHGFEHSSLNKDTALNPNSPYAKSKLLADQFIQSSGSRHAIIRFGGIFGPNGPAHLGINNTIKNAARGIPPKLVGNGDGKRNYIFVDDAAALIAHVVKQEMLGLFYAGAEVLKISTMLEQICETWMPGKVVERTTGSETWDQVNVPSAHMPPTRKFRDCLDICKTRLA